MTNRLRVKSMADAIKQLKAWKAESEKLVREKLDLETSCDQLKDNFLKEQDAKNALRRQFDEVKSNFADLKKKLHDSELEVSRLNGFMQRVREEDAVNDPLVEIEDQNGKRQVSKRFPSNSMQYFGNALGNDEYVRDEYGRQTKKPHWTSY